MNNRVEPESDRNLQQQRRAYQSPQLMTYGAVRELTTGGSGKAVETNKGQADKRP
jgi:hypothetical protein